MQERADEVITFREKTEERQEPLPEEEGKQKRVVVEL